MWIDVDIIDALSEAARLKFPRSEGPIPGQLCLVSLGYPPHCTASHLPFAATLRCLDMYQASQAKAKQADHQTHTHMPIACETQQS